MLNRTTHRQIVDNSVTDANLSSQPFGGIEGAQFFADAFTKNTRIEKLNLKLCSINDDQFKIINEAIIGRKKPLELLNLDYNYLTLSIKPELISLINSKNVKFICFYGIRDFFTHADSLSELEKIAIDNNVTFSILNPIVREDKYPTLFSTPIVQATTCKVEEERKDSIDLHQPNNFQVK